MVHAELGHHLVSKKPTEEPSLGSPSAACKLRPSLAEQAWCLLSRTPHLCTPKELDVFSKQRLRGFQPKKSAGNSVCISPWARRCGAARDATVMPGPGAPASKTCSHPLPCCFLGVLGWTHPRGLLGLSALLLHPRPLLHEHVR